MRLRGFQTAMPPQFERAIRFGFRAPNIREAEVFSMMFLDGLLNNRMERYCPCFGNGDDVQRHCYPYTFPPPTNVQNDRQHTSPLLPVADEPNALAEISLHWQLGLAKALCTARPAWLGYLVLLQWGAASSRRICSSYPQLSSSRVTRSPAQSLA